MTARRATSAIGALHCVVYSAASSRLLIALALTGCMSNAPAAVKDCSVQAVGAEHVAFKASVFPRSGKAVAKVDIIVRTSGGTPAGGSLIDYAFDGVLSPGLWTNIRSVKNVRADPATLDQHLGSIEECYVHAVVFEDKTHWLGPSPDM